MQLLSVIHGPAFGGAHNQAFRLAGPLRDRGIQTLVALPTEADEPRRRLEEAGVEVVSIPLGRLRATPSPVAQGRFAASLRRDLRSLRSLIRNRSVEVVQVHGPTNPQAAIAAHREGVGVTWQILDTRAPVPLRWAARPLITRLTDAMTVWGAELALSQPGAASLGERVFEVFPPVDSRVFDAAAPAREDARHRLGVDHGEILIGTVGVLNPQKGHETFIASARELGRARDDVKFAVIGASSPAHESYEGALRRQAAAANLRDRLVFVDPGEDVPKLMHALDVLALTSAARSEGMPTVILEAMFCGKPVVASDVGAVRRLVGHGETGFLVPPGSPDAVARAFASLAGDPELRAKFSHAARAKAENDFSLNALADIHARAYAVAQSHRARRDQ